MRLFDAHCHLQDPRVLDKARKLISEALDAGVLYFAVNGTSQKDWQLVKEMGETYPSVIPCFGLHPWFIRDRTPDWFEILKDFFKTATAPVGFGEIGLDKSSLVPKEIEFADQLEVFKKQLELAKELKLPITVHCLLAFDELIEIMKPMAPFPSGIILHSFQGSAELVPKLAKLDCYFSISGHTMSMNDNQAKAMLKAVPCERLLLETDAPDGLPKPEYGPLYPVDGDPSLNHPANIHSVLNYVACMLEKDKEDIAEQCYNNAVRLFLDECSELDPKS